MFLGIFLVVMLWATPAGPTPIPVSEPIEATCRSLGVMLTLAGPKWALFCLAELPEDTPEASGPKYDI